MHARMLLDGDGRSFELLLVNDVERGGQSLELWDVGPAPGRGLTMEAFRDEDGQRFTASSFTREDVPMNVLEWFVTTARRLLDTERGTVPPVGGSPSR
ncbi:MAG: hypothetical protein U0Q15_10625 [Kineosporiaceae bacterium]